jgi:hypothetical protein
LHELADLLVHLIYEAESFVGYGMCHICHKISELFRLNKGIMLAKLVTFRFLQSLVSYFFT